MPIARKPNPMPPPIDQEVPRTPGDFRAARDDLALAAAALRVDSAVLFRACDPPWDYGETADAFGRWLRDLGIRHFRVPEVTTPNNRALARRAGYEELVPPWWLWPWAGLALAAADRCRVAARGPVRCRNLWRPASYNALVASSGENSDHPAACCVDLDFRSQDARRAAERAMRDLDRRHEKALRMSLGMGARTLHVGILSPLGRRWWFYASYRDPRRGLGLDLVS